MKSVHLCRCFPGTSSRIGGLDLTGVGRATLAGHLQAFDNRYAHGDEVQANALPDPGEYRHRDLQDGSAEVRRALCVARVAVASLVNLHSWCMAGAQAMLYNQRSLRLQFCTGC